ncbi:cullin [Acrasis kona]|uniref:Cullin n=1 Tax=Acrasis kona TaxID=1008807 RepID=A0AAW2Z1I5_9EUKA
MKSSAPANSSKLVIPNYISRKGSLQKNDVQDKYTKIMKAIDQIYEENASSLSFQILYTSGYHIVLNKHGDFLYDGVKEALSNYIKGVREKTMKCNDESFLKELLTQWDKHRTSVGMVRDILMYMDRNYVQQNKKIPVFDLGVKLFGQEVFHQNTLDRIQRLIMEIIRKDRDGEVVADRFLLKNLCVMMLEISKPEIYITHFENKFITESREYFSREAAVFFEKCTATDYLQKVVERLKEERERATRCLDEESKAKIESVIKQVMINNYKQSIIEKEGSGCIVMLREWRVNDLRLVFDVLGLVPKALDPCVQLVENYSREQGYQIVKDQEMDEKPLEMIERLIQLKEKYEALLVAAFSTKKPSTDGQLGLTTHRDPEFTAAVKRAFDDIINANDRFPEYLSLYIDSKLKKGKQQILETEFDILFEQVIALFRHLREKDIFEKYYKNHLAKRLLGQKSQSDEAEKSFISKLKSEFGYQFTSKLEGMFSDMRMSRDTMETYKSHLQAKSITTPLDINVQVLTTGYWPITQAVSIAVPAELEKACDVFKEYYLHSHTGRRLTWQYNMGTADLRANGFDKKYELNVSTFQMIMLLLFNDSDTISFGQVLTATKIPSIDVKKNLLALTVKSKTHEKLLIRHPEKTLENTTTFTISPDFKSKLLKVKIAPVVLKESKEQVKETQEKVDEERKWQLDATIVRIMKARKSFEHRDLVVEVTKQLQQRFMPAPDLIKKRIESLIEREYLERDSSSRSKYNYLA